MFNPFRRPPPRPPAQTDFPPATLQLLRDLKDAFTTATPLMRSLITVSEDLSQKEAVVAADEVALAAQLEKLAAIAKSFPDQLAAAITSVKAGGVTADQLKALDDLHAKLTSDLAVATQATADAQAQPAAEPAPEPAPQPEPAPAAVAAPEPAPESPADPAAPPAE